MLRNLLCCLPTVCALLWPAAEPLTAAERVTENVILVTIDGLRWQEVFSGAEEALLNKEHGGVAKEKDVRKQFWRETPEERRSTLMPFFWSTIASQGQIYGNSSRGSTAQLTNTMKFSYPGYNEILTGFADPRITSNAKKPNENFTVLEWLHRKPAFDGKVAAFSGWDVMPFIINRGRCDFPVMGGWESSPEPDPNSREQLLNELVTEMTRIQPAELPDPLVFHMAHEHLLRHQPRVLMVSFLETDHWGHAGRYDHVLSSANMADRYLAKLWETVQSLDQYRGKTTLIVSPDHGRGDGLSDWKNHGVDIAGAEFTWLAFLGPDTPPLGERADCETVTQSQIAATLADLLGEDFRADFPQAGAVIKDVLPQGK